MPELPEVETTAQLLGPALVGSTIVDVQLSWPRHTPDPERLIRELPGHAVRDLGRRGKYLVVGLEPSDRTLFVHLGMSGRLTVRPADALPDPYARTVFVLQDGRQWRFADPRKFGRVLLVADPEEVTGRLGPEPLAGEFTADWLAAGMAARRRAVKPLLLQQRFLAGLGNIYADEALHRAGVSPRRAADSLKTGEVVRLWESIREVLNEAIAHHGTSLDWVYPDGGMQELLRVYGRAGKPCLACGTPVEREVLAQRSTHYCPRCQPG